MAGRTRSAKALAQRIDLNYFKRPHPFRRLRLALSIAVPALALVWLATYAVAGSQAPYTSGPVSSAHASFGMKCGVCHRTESSGIAGFRAHVTNGACVSCHSAPRHKANETFTPDCPSCHIDHQGRVPLAAVNDRSCTQCHGDLKSAGDAPKVAARVGAFDAGHPEFRAVRNGSHDRTALRFNHKVHLKKDLRGATGPVTLECAACHTYQASRVRPQASGTQSAQSARVTYGAQCASCHPLFFDPSIDKPAPHDKPEIVRAFVRESLRVYIAEHPEDLTKPDVGRGRIPENFPVERLAPARTPAEWADRRSAAAERLLWGTACRECHVMGVAAPGQSPSSAPVNMPQVWMPHARFEHRSHQLVNCESCHAARESRETSDVLLPSIATCQRCHNGGRNSAESRCFECHEYHDWTRAKPVRSRFRLSDLTN